MTTRIIIAIDGHSSTGKSTFAKLIASKLGYIYIDTGAMYRAVTLAAIRKGFLSTDNTIDEKGLSDYLASGKEVRITFKATGENGKSETYLDGENIENQIRTLKISNSVSYIASLPFIRDYVDKILVEIGKNKGVVMDGRDIGTAVFPDAELKIFMTADPKVRAERRLREMEAKGEKAVFEDVLANIKERDYMDEHRETAPLVRASDAILLDNSHMTIPQQMDWIFEILNRYENRNR